MTETTPSRDVPPDYKSENIKKECCILLRNIDMTKSKTYDNIIKELKENYGYLYKIQNVISSHEKISPPEWWDQKLVATLRYMGYNASLKIFTSNGITHNGIGKNITGSSREREILTTYILEVSCF
jgi:tRNA G26 N,N-dimethylase Trm1